VHLICVTRSEDGNITITKDSRSTYPYGTMKNNSGIKTRDFLILLGILIAILIGLTTKWALAGEMIFSSIIH